MFELLHNCKIHRHFDTAYTPVAAAWLWYWKLIGHTEDSLTVYDVNASHTWDNIFGVHRSAVGHL